MEKNATLLISGFGRWIQAEGGTKCGEARQRAEDGDSSGMCRWWDPVIPRSLQYSRRPKRLSLCGQDLWRWEPTVYTGHSANGQTARQCVISGERILPDKTRTAHSNVGGDKQLKVVVRCRDEATTSLHPHTMKLLTNSSEMIELTLPPNIGVPSFVTLSILPVVTTQFAYSVFCVILRVG